MYGAVRVQLGVFCISDRHEELKERIWLLKCQGNQIAFVKG